MFKLLILALSTNYVFSADANGQCPSADRYCLSCNATACSGCAYAYPDSAGKCQPPTTTIANCVMYTSATTCGACDDRYYLSGNSCVAIPAANCYDVTNTAPTFCTECDNNKQYDTATGKCNDTACGITNCERCTAASDNKFVCSHCNNGYSLNETGACVSEVTANCILTVGSTCAMCRPGYYDSGSTCTKSDLYSYNGVKSLSMITGLFALLSLLF